MKKAAKKKLQIELPWPPSVNEYWAPNGHGGIRVSRKGVDYKRLVRCSFLQSHETLERPVGVRVVARGPSERRYDLDNLLKASFDAITEAGIWKDDRLVDSLSVVRGPKSRPPHMLFWIWEL